MPCHHDVVAVHRLRVLAGPDVDRGHAREEAPAVEQALDNREHARVQGHRLECRVLRQQVVHAQRRVTLGERCLRLHVELGCHAPDRRQELLYELGIDCVLEDGVAVGLDAGEVFGHRGLGQCHA